MSFYNRLSDLIAEKNLTFRKVERECGLVNATIRRWETQSPRLESVITVAQYLGVSIDYLAIDCCENTTCGDRTLNSWENSLITMIKCLNKHDRENVFDFVTMLYEKAAGKKGSVYLTYTEDEQRQTNKSIPSDAVQDGIA